MKRLALNASPRAEAANSVHILQWTMAGMQKAGSDQIPLLHLARGAEEALRAFLDADVVLIAFPLYTDFVPALLKEFLDTLAGLDRILLTGKRVAWIVHSGFPESAHSEGTAAWLPRATERLGMVCAGVLVKGGSEGFRMMPPEMTKKVRTLFGTAGASLTATGHFDRASAEALAGRRKLSLAARLVMGALKPTGLLNFYWNSMLKKHKAMDRRFDAPHGEAF